MDSVKDKVILVTGGAGGIGFAIVKGLLNNGAKGVAIVDLSFKAAEEITQNFGTGKVIFIKTDVTQKKELEDAFDTTVKTFKQLDIVINNAGIIDEEDWIKSIAVNLVAVIEGTYLAMQKYLPKYKSGPEGVIVNTASVSAFQNMICAPVYCVTKHGVVGLGKVLGSEDFYNKYRVRVLTICPGVVDTPMNSGLCTSKFFFPDRVTDDNKLLNPVSQPPELVAEAFIEVIKFGKNGSLWVTENEKPPYEIVVPGREALRV